MEVQISSKFLSLCEHPSFLVNLTKDVPSQLIEPFAPLMPENWFEGKVYWHPGPDHYGLAELNGKKQVHWLLYRDNALLASDGVTLAALIQTPSVEKLWGHRGLPADRALLIRAEEVGDEEHARCIKKNNGAIEALRKRKGAKLLYLTDDAWGAFEPLCEFPKRVTVPAPEDVLAYLATYRKLPALPWD